MKANLKIENFGPIESVDLELRKFNIIIGSHSSGKSTISKLLCIFHSVSCEAVSSAQYNKDAFRESLNFYQIENFYRSETYIEFQDQRMHFELRKSKINIKYNLSKENSANKSNVCYVPAERIALPLLDALPIDAMINNLKLPKYVMKFYQDFLNVKRTYKAFNLPLFNMQLESVSGEDIITLKNNRRLTLEEMSSAIRGNVSTLVTLEYLQNDTSVFVIEEPELHNFPDLQKNLLYQIASKLNAKCFEDTYVIISTQSPYILSAANNLLLAGKVGRRCYDRVVNIIPASSWIDVKNLAAYLLLEGKAYTIIHGETGLIGENELDNVSEELAGEFDKLLDL